MTSKDILIALGTGIIGFIFLIYFKDLRIHALFWLVFALWTFYISRKDANSKEFVLLTITSLLELLGILWKYIFLNFLHLTPYQFLLNERIILALDTISIIILIYFFYKISSARNI